MLANNPSKVIAIDLNPAQIFCLELRVAAYKALEYHELLEFMGVKISEDRLKYYHQCRKFLTKSARSFWDEKQEAVKKHGIGGVGKFEHYFRIFNKWILPLAHSKASIDNLLSPKSIEERERFFDHVWNTWRWRLLVRLFFSKTVMGKIGRDPAFFTYVGGSLSNHVFSKIKHGMRTLNPAENHYLHWILNGTYGEALPFSLRRENYEKIRKNLDKIEWHVMSIEDFSERCKQDNTKISKYNLSNVFEYMSEENYLSALSKLIDISQPGARFLYWNMMVPRSCPSALKNRLKSHIKLAKNLHVKDKAIFYNNLIIEEAL